MLDLELLILIPQVVHQLCIKPTKVCRFPGLGAKTAISSAYNKAATFLSFIPVYQKHYSLAKSSMYKANNVGERMHPCLTPVFTSNQSEYLVINFHSAVHIFIHSHILSEVSSIRNGN